MSSAANKSRGAIRFLQFSTYDYYCVERTGIAPFFEEEQIAARFNLRVACPFDRKGLERCAARSTLASSANHSSPTVNVTVTNPSSSAADARACPFLSRVKVPYSCVSPTLCFSSALKLPTILRPTRLDVIKFQFLPGSIFPVMEFFHSRGK